MSLGWAQHLILETVKVLCKNALPFERKLSIEGLLTITMDECDTVLIELNEYFDLSDIQVPSTNAHERVDVNDLELLSRMRYKGVQTTKKTPDNGSSGLLRGKNIDDGEVEDDAVSIKEETEEEDDDSNDEDGVDYEEDDNEVVCDDYQSDADSENLLSKETTGKKVKVPHTRRSKSNKCNYCDKVFSSEQYLRDHHKTHVGERPYQCTICDKHYKQRGHLFEHKKTHTGEKLYECPYCCRRFVTNRSCVRHQRIHTGEKPFHCELCDYTAAQKCSVDVHMLKHRGSRPHCCSICNCKYWTRSSLKEHFSSKHPHLMLELMGSMPASSANSESGDNTGDAQDNVHQSITKETQNDTHVSVGQQIPDNAHFSEVLTILQETVADADAEQGDTDLNMTEMTLIKMDDTTPQAIVLPTSPIGPMTSQSDSVTLPSGEECDAVRASPALNAGTFVRVTDAHKNLKMTPAWQDRRKKPNDQQMCATCGKIFGNVNRLEAHMLTHTEEKSYICPACGKAFRQKGHLLEHHRIHTGELPHECTHCLKKFSTNRQLVKHTRIHTGERPYQCPVCKFAFTQRSSLVGHMRRHTGEKPYICGGCNKKYATKTSLRDHMLKKHGEEIMAQLNIEAEQQEQREHEQQGQQQHEQQGQQQQVEQQEQHVHQQMEQQEQPQHQQHMGEAMQDVQELQSLQQQVILESPLKQEPREDIMTIVQ